MRRKRTERKKGGAEGRSWLSCGGLRRSWREEAHGGPPTGLNRSRPEPKCLSSLSLSLCLSLSLSFHRVWGIVKIFRKHGPLTLFSFLVGSPPLSRVLQRLSLPDDSPFPLHRRRAKHLTAVRANLQRFRNNVPSTRRRHPKSNEAHLREPKIELLLCARSCLGLKQTTAQRGVEIQEPTTSVS